MTRNKKAFFWTVFDKIGIQSFTFVIGIFLARLLTPFDYGVVGLSTIFISLTDILIESGFSNALIRKQDRNQTDLSTAFYFNISISLLLYILLLYLFLILQMHISKQNNPFLSQQVLLLCYS